MASASADSPTVEVHVWSNLFDGRRGYHVSAEFSAGDLKKHLSLQMSEADLRLKYNSPRQDIPAGEKLSAMHDLSFYVTRKLRADPERQALSRFARGKTKSVIGKHLRALQENQKQQTGAFKEQAVASQEQAAALKEQTAACKEQTAASKEQTEAVKELAVETSQILLTMNGQLTEADMIMPCKDINAEMNALKNYKDFANQQLRRLQSIKDKRKDEKALMEIEHRKREVAASREEAAAIQADAKAKMAESKANEAKSLETIHALTLSNARDFSAEQLLVARENSQVDLALKKEENRQFSLENRKRELDLEFARERNKQADLALQRATARKRRKSGGVAGNTGSAASHGAEVQALN